MSRRSTSTLITPLPASTSRRDAIAHLHDHLSMIDLNPLVESRHHLMCPPSHAPADELGFTWYSITDRVIPGLPAPVSYTAAFHNTPSGLQTHVYAPMGLEIRERWTVAGSAPGEEEEGHHHGRPRPAVSDGIEVPRSGLYIREDIDIKCNVLVGGFIRKTLKKAHETLLARITAESRLGASCGPPLSMSPCSFVTGDEMFLGPYREKGPPVPEPNESARSNNWSDAGRAPPSRTRQPAKHMLTRAAKATRPPSFLQAPRPPSTSRLSRAPPSSPPRIPRPTSDPEVCWPRPPSSLPAASPPTPSLYPAPLRVRHRHSTAPTFYMPTPVEPSSLPAWALDAFFSSTPPPSPQLASPQRTVSVVSRYPDAAKQDYSDIAAMNPFVNTTPDTPTSPAPSASTYSSSTYPLATPVSARYSSNTDPDTFPSSSSPDSSPPATTPALDLPANLPRLHLRHRGQGLGISIPGEMLEETYAGPPWTEPQELADTSTSLSPESPLMQGRLSGPACYELY